MFSFIFFYVAYMILGEIDLQMSFRSHYFTYITLFWLLDWTWVNGGTALRGDLPGIVTPWTPPPKWTQDFWEFLARSSPD